MARRRQQYPFDAGLRRTGRPYGKQGHTRDCAFRRPCVHRGAGGRNLARLCPAHRRAGLERSGKSKPDSGHGRRVACAKYWRIRRGSERRDSQRALFRFGYGNLCRAFQCRLPLRLPRKPVQAGRQRALCDCFGRIRPERVFRAEFGLRRFGSRRCRTERGQNADGERCF